MKRIGLSIAVAAVLGLTGCGGGGGGGSSSSNDSLSGTASKGIIVNGLVSAYLFDVVTGLRGTTAIATDITDANGEYALAIPTTHRGKPIYIEVDDNDGAATMKCDIAGGCDSDGDGTVDAAFGADLDLDPGDLTMSAVLAASAASVSVNLTPLTTVAAELAEDAVSSLGSAFLNATNIQEAINNANSQVAERFGLTGDITQIDVVDLTDPSEVAAAILGDANSVEYAALNAAIISAMQADALASISINEAIENFAENFVNNGLTTNAATGALTDLGDILGDALVILTEVVVDLTALGGDYAVAVAAIGELVDDIESDKSTADGATASDEGDQGTPSLTANATKLAKVKAFVEELRELTTVIGSAQVVQSQSVDVNSIESMINGFEAQKQAADLASSVDSQAAIKALGTAVESIVDVFNENYLVGPAGPVSLITSYPTELVSAKTGLTVNVARSAGVYTFRVDDADVVVAVDEVPTTADVDVSVTVTELETSVAMNEFESGSATGAVDMNIAGTVQSGTIDLDVANGIIDATLALTVDGEEIVTETGSTSTESLSVTLTGFNLDLDVTLGQIVGEEISADDAMSFTGGLAIEVSSLVFAEESTEQNGPGENEAYSEEISLSLGVVGFELDGTFGNATEEFAATFSFNGDATGVPAFTFLYSESFDGDNYNWDSSESGGETPSNYADVSMSLTFDAKLAGIADQVQFSFEVERTGFDDVKAIVMLKYPGRIINITAEMNDIDGTGDGTLTLSNNDGVVIVLEGVESTDALSGSITLDGTVYAVLDEAEGMEIIRYSDGSFVSAF